MDMDLSVEIYHERQVRELCALHALNNLFQDKKAFSKKDLDEICLSLSPESLINPHRSFLGLGNYDVNVLMAALQRKEYDTVWFDKRKDISCLNPDNIFGFILNTPSDYKWGFLHFPFKRKHWISFRRIGNAYYNLDSKLDSPELIGDKKLLLEYLHNELKEGNKELLLVVNSDISEAGTWRFNNEHCSSDTQLENGQQTYCDNGQTNAERMENGTPKQNLQSMDDL